MASGSNADNNETFIDFTQVPPTPSDEEPAELSQLNVSRLTADLNDLVDNDPQRIYLVTYSNADTSKFPTRKSFGYAVVTAFGGNKVSYFSCAREHHASGNPHYHLALKLSKSYRWLGVKKSLKAKHGITVNFKESPDGGMYSRVHRYILKEDAGIYTGSVLEKHPNLDSLLVEDSGAAHANAAYRKKRKDAKAAASTAAAAAAKSDEAGGKKPKGTGKGANNRRVEKFDILLFIRRHNIRTDTELLATCEERVIAGQDDLARYVINKFNPKSRVELIKDAWKMAGSIQEVALI